MAQRPWSVELHLPFNGTQELIGLRIPRKAARRAQECDSASGWQEIR